MFVLAERELRTFTDVNCEAAVRQAIVFVDKT